MKRSIVSALFCVLMAHACQRGLRVPVVDPRVAAGRSLFEEHCVACHAMDGRGSGRGADLTGPLKRGRDRDALARVVRQGSPGLMPGFALSDSEIQSVVSYVLYLNQGGGR